ncbi:MAG: cupin domain-containing protein [Pseudomonadota bacterium]
MTGPEIIERLGLARHPEGGWYRQTWIAQAGPDDRPAGTCIYFLLQAGEQSHWHRVDATEIWHYYAGAPLRLRISADANGPAVGYLLGPDLTAGQEPQVIVPTHHWQSADSLGDWTLVGCTVSPGFQFDGFELAAPDFDISD